MLTRRPIPRRPPLSAPRGQLRAAWRLTAGMSRANLARAEGVAPADVDALLGQPDIYELLMLPLIVAPALRELVNAQRRARRPTTSGSACCSGFPRSPAASSGCSAAT